MKQKFHQKHTLNVNFFETFFFLSSLRYTTNLIGKYRNLNIGISVHMCDISQFCLLKGPGNKDNSNEHI